MAFAVLGVPRSKIKLPDYLSFTRKERTGIITLAVLILIFISVPFFFPFFIQTGQVDHTAFQQEIAALDIKQQSREDNEERRSNDDARYQYAEPGDGRSIKGELFYFDPNTLSIEGWKRLGVKERTARTIQKYISKGGRFREPKDISKVWGLREEDVETLMPYVRIAPKQESNAFSTAAPDKKFFEKPRHEIKQVDINAADTAAWIALPGIGSKLAARIVLFREKLGGFYKVEQVAETFGLHDSVFQKIRNRLFSGSSTIRKLNINTATIDELKTHPYLRYHLANAIVQYRQQHGKFGSLTDLKQIMTITPDIYDKLLPYLAL